MFQELVTILNNGYALFAAAVGIIALLIKILSMLGQALDFHDKHFVENGHRRLVLLRKGITDEDLLGEFLDDAIKFEAFRLASGVRAGALKAAALMTLQAWLLGLCADPTSV